MLFVLQSAFFPAKDYVHRRCRPQWHLPHGMHKPSHHEEARAGLDANKTPACYAMWRQLYLPADWPLRLLSRKLTIPATITLIPMSCVRRS